MLILVFIILFPLIGWYIGTGLFDFITSNNFKSNLPEKPTEDTYIIDNNFDNRQVHLHSNNIEEDNTQI